MTELSLFADGGVIQVNPSPIGGVYAFRVVKDGEVIEEHNGVILPAEAELPALTNNLTEMLAVVRGLACLPSDFAGVVYSDSQVTLGRLSMGWKWNNIPMWLHHEYQAQRARLVNWDKITWVLLDGHPTKAELAANMGKRGHPVSEHNVACDKMCHKAAMAQLEKSKVKA